MTETQNSRAVRRGPAIWLGFAIYAAISVIHVATILLRWDAATYPTKLLLMPALAVAAWMALRTTAARRKAGVLFAAVFFSWLGDGASFFFPFVDDELPAMLLCFGIAHLAYTWLFLRVLRVRAVPVWTLVYALWWGILLAVLWPHLGALAFAVAGYGVVLAVTAVAATRGNPVTTLGGGLFLLSDTLLAFRLFLPDALPESLGSPAIMITYTAGQGLLILGATAILRRRERTDA